MGVSRNISISEINSYQYCRRAWDLTANHRQSLRHKSTPKVFFSVGSGVHEAIDTQASGGEPLEAFEKYMDKEREEKVEAYKRETGQTPHRMQMEEFEEGVTLARGMVNQYFDHYGWENPLADRGLRYLATEVPFSIPLESGNNFVGTFDGLATDLATETKLYLVENKTAPKKPNLENVQSGNQFVGYSWAFQRLTGQAPTGLLYNGVIKALIRAPKTLVKGGLSKDKAARVTSASYLKAIQDGGHDPVEYMDHLEFLEERERLGDDRFFFRAMFTYTEGQMENWQANVLDPVDEEMGRENLKIIPNYNSCDRCLVRDICQSMDLEEDTEALIAQRYKKSQYGTMKSVEGVTPSQVSSVEDLLALLTEDLV